MMLAVQRLDASSAVVPRPEDWSEGSTQGTLAPGKIAFTPVPSTETRPATPQGQTKLIVLVLPEPELTKRKTDTLPYPFHGEQFNLEIDDGVFSLRHPLWSLMGTGKTLLEAEVDLLGEAREVAHAMLELPIKTLSFEAFRLREFLLRII